MSEMVDRVKAAIEQTANVGYNYGDPKVLNPEEVARAVISAMREPTVAMLQEGLSYAYQAMEGDGEGGQWIDGPTFSKVWPAMITAALAEESSK